MMSILVTGGAGFIGSHTCIELMNAGYDVVIADNLYNSKALVIDRMEQITGKRPAFYEIDILDEDAVEALFEKEEIEAVIHFAGYKAVGESVQKPLEYYQNNLGTTLALCEVMRRHGCFQLVFSSSATVYGDPAQIPITEECPLGVTTNPYGATKSMQERILTDLHTGDPSRQVLKLIEEQGELAAAIARDNHEEMADAIGDVIVVAIVMAKQLNAPVDLRTAFERTVKGNDEKVDLNAVIASLAGNVSHLASFVYYKHSSYAGHLIENVITMVADVADALDIDYISAVQSAYDTIKDRKGKLVNGVFIKEDE